MSKSVLDCTSKLTGELESEAPGHVIQVGSVYFHSAMILTSWSGDPKVIFLQVSGTTQRFSN